MDFATLGIKIDSSQAKKAFEDLEKLDSAGKGAEKAVEDVGKAADKAASGLESAGKATKEAASSVDAYTRKVDGLAKSQVAAAAAAKQVEISTKGVAAAQSSIAKGGLDAAEIKRASTAIDEQVTKLQLVATTNGMSARESRLYELAVQGASKAQLQAADSAIRMNEGYERGVAIGERVRAGLIATAAAAAALAVGALVAASRIADSIANYQDLSEKIGDTASSIATLQEASDTSEVSLDTVAAASIRLTSALSKTDDESKLVAKGIKALGLNFEEFKKLSPVAQLDAVAGALAGFKDGAEKSAVAVAIFGRGAAELLPFLNDLADGGERQLRLSDEQIKAADDFTKAQSRLKSEITQIAQVLVADSIPAVTALMEVIKQAVVGTDSLSRAASDLGSSNAIGSFAESAGRSLAGMIDYVTQSVRELKALVDFVSSSAEALQKYGSGDFAGGRKVGEDFRARYGLDDFGRKVSKSAGEESARTFVQAYNDTIAAAKRSSFAANDPRRVDLGVSGRARDGRPTVGSINTDKAARGGKSGAGQEAKAQLAFDLDDIRKAQDALSNTIANGEKLLEARRSANLITEAEYWKQKRVFLQQNESAQEAALEKELARLNQEQLTGKEKIDNDRKILDAQSKLAKVLENAATNLQILGVKEADALDKIRLKFQQAQEAADQYVETIAKANQREITGLGRGAQNREVDARVNQRDDQLLARRRALQDQLNSGQLQQSDFDRLLAIEKDAHAKALAEDERYWKEKLEKQQDWKVGATEALQNFIDEANNTAKRTETAITNGLGGLSDSLTDAIMGDGTKSFEDLGKSIARQFVKGFVDTEIIKPAAELLKNALKGDGSSGGGLSGILSMFGLGGSSNTGSGLAGAAGAVSNASSAAAASTAQAGLAASAAGATSALTALAAAASAAATAMGGSSISGGVSGLGALGGLFSGGGSGGGDALGALIAMNGWSEGGFTGAGGKYQPAGIVHAGEGVLSQAEVRAIGGETGFNFLRRMIKRGYADGGFVGSVLGGNLAPQGGDTNNNQKMEIHNHFAAGTNSQTIDQATQKLAAAIRRSQRNT